MHQHAIQFICGCFSGWSQVIIMQPFEIIKVRLVNQSLLNPIYNGIYDCFKKIYKQDGILGFYKGTLSPLLGNGAQVALQFGTNQLVKKAIKLSLNSSNNNNEVKYQNDQNYQQCINHLPINLIILSGILTGVPSSFVITPIDHMRIKMQTTNTQYHYKSSVSAGIQIYKKYGLKGLYQGLFPTTLREIIALGIYFGSYQGVIRRMNSLMDVKKREQSSVFNSFFAGGVAGCLSWTFTYPIDYLKTVIQSDCLQNPKYKSATHALIQKYQQQGVRTFFKGMGVTLLRAFPVNGIGFLTFQYCQRYFISSKKQNNNNIE